MKKEVPTLNPYRYNLHRSSLQFSSKQTPIKEREQHEEIEERIISLEKVSKVCVETMSEGVDSYWLMSKDLEKRVEDINQRVETLTKVVLEMADDRKLLVKVIKNQHDDITKLATRFACIAQACNLKREDTISGASFAAEEE
jgi:predicted transcriptional regulator